LIRHHGNDQTNNRRGGNRDTARKDDEMSEQKQFINVQPAYEREGKLSTVS
jgi:hypothetical protein